MANDAVSFQTLALNAELSENMGKLKIYTDFCQNAAICFYQNKYNGGELSQQDLITFKDKYNYMKAILDNTLIEFQDTLDAKKIVLE